MSMSIPPLEPGPFSRQRHSAVRVARRPASVRGGAVADRWTIRSAAPAARELAHTYEKDGRGSTQLPTLLCCWRAVAPPERRLRQHICNSFVLKMIENEPLMLRLLALGPVLGPGILATYEGIVGPHLTMRRRRRSLSSPMVYRPPQHRCRWWLLLRRCRKMDAAVFRSPGRRRRRRRRRRHQRRRRRRRRVHALGVFCTLTIGPLVGSCTEEKSGESAWCRLVCRLQQRRFSAAGRARGVATYVTTLALR
jgi:hypothetical protein